MALGRQGFGTGQEDAPAAERLVRLFVPAFMKLSAVQPYERVLAFGLEDATPALLAAGRAGDEGEVLAVDPRPERVEAARQRAEALGLRNIAFRVEDLDAPDLPRAWFDVALCYLTLTQVRDVVGTLRRLGEALREVGRLGVATWGQPDRNRWLTVLQTALRRTAPALADELARLPMFSLAEPGLLSRRLAEAGYQDVTPERSTAEVTFPDADAFWTFVAEEFDRTAPLLARLPAEQREAVREAALRGARWYRREDGLVWLPVEAFVGVAAK
ncbi:MAG TPA: methyltransferase domain-containing protein [Dehalococcoidia bacterium]